jgi:hypothetical protein
MLESVACPSRATSSIMSFSSRQPFIPQEVIDYIIDHLHDDKETLRKCSLVSRAWLPSSSLHLFECLAWPPCFHAWDDIPSRTCRCSTLDHSSFWEVLLDFCRGSSRVHKNVRRLRVRFQWTVVDPHWARLEYQNRISLEELSAGLDLLPHMRDLVLVNLGLRRAPYSRVSKARKVLDKLIFVDPRLRTADFSHSDGLRVLEFFSIFGKISTLVLSTVWDTGMEEAMIEDVTSSFAKSPNQLLEIDSLEIEHSWPPAIARYFRLLAATTNLNIISSFRLRYTMGWLSEPMIESIHDFLQSATNLASLSMDAVGYSQLLTISSACPRLRELNLRSHLNVNFGDGNGNGAHTTNWPTVFAILDRSLVPTLEVVSIQLVVHKLAGPSIPGVSYDRDLEKVQNALEMLDWALLDAVIDKFKTVNLQLALDTSSIPPSLHDPSLAYMAEMARTRVSARTRDKFQNFDIRGVCTSYGFIGFNAKFRIR